jgi:hypothetical protein
MSTRKERRVKAAMEPLLEEVKKYVEDENKAKTLGLMGQVKLKIGAHYDRAKKETQLVLTFIENRAKTQVKAIKVKKAATSRKIRKKVNEVMEPAKEPLPNVTPA